MVIQKLGSSLIRDCLPSTKTRSNFSLPLTQNYRNNQLLFGSLFARPHDGRWAETYRGHRQLDKLSTGITALIRPNTIDMQYFRQASEYAVRAASRKIDQAEINSFSDLYNYFSRVRREIEVHTLLQAYRDFELTKIFSNAFRKTLETEYHLRRKLNLDIHGLDTSFREMCGLFRSVIRKSKINSKLKSRLTKAFENLRDTSLGQLRQYGLVHWEYLLTMLGKEDQDGPNIRQAFEDNGFGMRFHVPLFKSKLDKQKWIEICNSKLMPFCLRSNVALNNIYREKFINFIGTNDKKSYPEYIKAYLKFFFWKSRADSDTPEPGKCRYKTMYGDINSEQIPLGHYSLEHSVIWHTDPAYHHTIETHLNELYHELESQKSKLSREQALTTIAKIYWWTANAVFVRRGNSSIANMVLETLLRRNNIATEPFRKNVAGDYEALLTQEGDFVENFKARRYGRIAPTLNA